MTDNLVDFLTFISPICILILFFMCFFRFLFRSCECGGHSDDAEACSSRPTSSSLSRVHPVCRMHPDLETGGPYGDMICHQHCEHFPPKYEDALKMAVCPMGAEETRRLEDQPGPAAVVATGTPTTAVPVPRQSICSPPPIYSNRPDSRDVHLDPTPVSRESSTGGGEEPPAYATSASASLFDQASLQVTTNAVLTGVGSRPLPLLDDDQLLCMERPQQRLSTSASRIATATSVRRQASARPPRMPLPGAVEASDDEEEEEREGGEAAPVSHTSHRA